MVQKGLENSIDIEKGKRRRGKKLGLSGEEDGGPVLWSPNRCERALQLHEEKEAAKAQEKVNKEVRKAESTARKKKEEEEKVEKARLKAVEKEEKEIAKNAAKQL